MLNNKIQKAMEDLGYTFETETDEAIFVPVHNNTLEAIDNEITGFIDESNSGIHAEKVEYSSVEHGEEKNGLYITFVECEVA